MSLLELGPVIFEGNEGIIDFLRQHHLLASQCNCAGKVASSAAYHIANKLLARHAQPTITQLMQ